MENAGGGVGRTRLVCTAYRICNVSYRIFNANAKLRRRKQLLGVREDLLQGHLSDQPAQHFADGDGSNTFVIVF